MTAETELLAHHPDAMLEGTLIVVTQNRVRIRSGEHEKRGQP